MHNWRATNTLWLWEPFGWVYGTRRTEDMVLPLIVLLYPRLCVIGWETMIYRNVHTHLSPITLHPSLSHTTRRFSLVHTARSCPRQLTVIATTDSVLFFIESAVDTFEFSVINPVFLYANKQLFKYICHVCMACTCNIYIRLTGLFPLQQSL